MLARVPWTPLKAQAKPRQLNRDKRKHLIDTVANLMKAAKESGAAATLMNFEGPCRHGLRSRLCLEGWNWRDADAMAAEIVAAAMRQIGAQRPSWAEGQQEWVQNGSGAMIERTRCVRCHGPLPDMHTKFCSDTCAGAHHMALASIKQAEEARAYDMIVNYARASWWRYHCG